MSWGDVVGWVGVESSQAALDPARADAGRNEFVAWMASMGADTTAAREGLRFPLQACADAAPEPGRHPLVLLAVGRDDSPAMHALLGEELAANGWVVLSAPGLGAEERPMQFDAADIGGQVDDLKALATHAASLEFVDPSQPAVVGFSYGGGSAILYAMADTMVSVVVSLDGSIGFADRMPSYVSLPGWRPERAYAPVLHLRAPDDQRKDLSALESLASPARVETIEGASHYDFTILGAVSANGLPIPPLGLDDSDGDELHSAIVRATVAFLDEHRPSGRD
jgi:dienelactone hydrolase